MTASSSKSGAPAASDSPFPLASELRRSAGSGARLIFVSVGVVGIRRFPDITSPAKRSAACLGAIIGLRRFQAPPQCCVSSLRFQ